MGIPIVQVDAFTDSPFAGNPAAVCVLPAPRSERWMRDVAREMNLSETAFLHPEADGYRLRWFTPVAESDLCGHATIGSAHVLFRHLGRKENSLAFHSHSGGDLRVDRVGERLVLDFPSRPATDCEAPALLAAV